MASVAVVFASTWGRTRAIVARFAARAQARGAAVAVHDLAAGDPGVPEADVLVIASAVYSNEHHGDVLRWLRTHGAALAGRDVRLISVSLAAAQPTDAGEGSCWDYVSELGETTGWEPTQVAFVAGGLDESRYDPATRALLRVASWRAGLGVQGDVVLTDDAAVDALADRWVG